LRKSSEPRARNAALVPPPATPTAPVPFKSMSCASPPNVRILPILGGVKAFTPKVVSPST
jgi:hypothetical protein